jgi:hypothetical protein
MDNVRDKRLPVWDPNVRLVNPAPGWIPRDGFAWIEGFRHPFPRFAPFPGRFLAAQSPHGRQQPIPDDAYLRFMNTEPSDQGLLDFFNRHGSLHLSMEHFHASPGNEVRYGDELEACILEHADLKEAFDVFEICSHGDERQRERELNKFIGIDRHRFLAQVSAGNYQFSPDLRRAQRYWAPGPFAPLESERPIDTARQGVIALINDRFARGISYHVCHHHGCGGVRHQDVMQAGPTPMIRSTSKPRFRAELSLVSLTLGSAIWAQFADHVCGKRKVKRCVAEDCGKLMDVTESDRPGARLMHKQCAERHRKRRYRGKAKGVL